jgi:cell division protease FtsH
MTPKDTKKPKKPLPKKPNQNSPQIKIIEISLSKLVLPIIGILLLIALLWNFSGSGVFSDEKNQINEKIWLNQLLAEYNSGTYEEVRVEGSVLYARKPIREVFINNQKVKYRDIDKLLIPENVKITDLGLWNPEIDTKVVIKSEGFGKMLSDLLPSLLGTILLVVIFFWFLSRMSGGGMGGPMAFIKSRAKVYDPEMDEKVTFEDVAGSDEEKADLVEIVDFLKSPQKYKDLGAKIPRGILLQGPPGTGKTLLARAVAGEAGVPFFSISGSEFVEMFVGVGASRVRDLFKDAREAAPSIIFIDEIDAIGKKRSPGIGWGHDEREQTLNQILTEMDGFDNETNVIIMAATNRADVLDKALLRPGRFDRRVTINLPTLEDRKKILAVHAKGKPFDESVNWEKIAGITVGFSGAELWNLLNEAAILAGKNNNKSITMEMIQKSVEKVVMGNEKKSLRMTEHEKRLTAIHEVWHALVGKMLAHTDPVHKISILPRGGAGGVTWFLPEKDRTYTSKAKYLDELATLYGGRVAEEVFFGSEYITTGASSDIERATEIARAMVMRFGFDPEIGPENLAPDMSEGNFLGGQSNAKVISDKTQDLIDSKVRALLLDAYALARKIITTNKDLHEKIAHALLEREEMLQDEFDLFFVDVKGLPQKVAM